MTLFDRGKKSRAAVLALLLAACTGAAAEPAAGPAPQPGAAPGDAAAQQSADSIAAALQRATLPPSARQAQFSWSLDEAGARFSGRGVARFRAPDRFRLDLFGPRGETYLAAALVGEEARVPPAVTERFKLPSPALLWATVGVVVPPSGARLVSATSEGGQVFLRYALGDEGTLELRAQGGRLQQVRRLRGGGVQESIDLDFASDGSVQRARYRDWIALRTLTLTLETRTDVPSFPEDTWSPPGTGR